MGLSNAISGGIIMFGITYVIFTFGGFTDQAALFSDASTETSDLENKILKTSFTIDSIVTAAPASTFTVDITNTGIEKLWAYDKFDMIITYDSAGTTYTESLEYAEVCGVGKWCITLFSNDVIDPEIINQGESIIIECTISRLLQSGTTMIIVISTDNGVVVKETKLV